jgi:hypothetical protein
MKILPVGAELVHAGRRTDVHDAANSRFLQFCKSALKTQHAWIAGHKFICRRVHNILG